MCLKDILLINIIDFVWKGKISVCVLYLKTEKRQGHIYKSENRCAIQFKSYPSRQHRLFLAIWDLDKNPRENNQRSVINAPLDDLTFKQIKAILYLTTNVEFVWVTPLVTIMRKKSSAYFDLISTNNTLRSCGSFYLMHN